ncbi:MAG TPA: TRAP transporter fused permease subunit [Vicinamibacterales bacterium]|nr:TRAP transporter fused permease subunit [Vicinamibacterales bacterium]
MAELTPPVPSAGGATRSGLTLTVGLSLALCVFTLSEVNYPRLGPLSELAIFALFGLVLCFLRIPVSPGLASSPVARAVDKGLALLAALCCGYLVWQTEPAFASGWFTGQSLGNRAGFETQLDIAVGVIGLLLVMEAARRTIGWSLPFLSGAFLVYAYFGSWMPGWLFPHRGYPIERIVSQTFLHSQGVFGVALSVMFTYVFLFVLFGAVLSATGATHFIVTSTARLFGRGTSGPAKVAVISSGLMGSLSGSAVANTATIGTFTIPLMRSVGFSPQLAAGIEAAASSGGALVPPVMGAGAYMMLEIVQPPVTYLQIIQAAIIPAILYYLSLYLIVHFYVKRNPLGTQPEVTGAGSGATVPAEPPQWSQGIVFFTALASLMLFLFLGWTAFRAVTMALGATVVISLFHASTRMSWTGLRTAMVSAALDAVPLVCAAACVGIVIGVVTLTGVGTRLPSAILPIAENSLFLALLLVMVSSIVLGMGLPSAVVYLLLATLVGPALGELGAVPLAAHLFIFYFGMMAMVTPPVALAAYAAASIAGSDIMKTGLTAFRFALVGFTLPFIFVYRPELLLLSADGPAAPVDVAQAVAVAVLGITMFAAGMAGCLFARATFVERLLFFVAAALLLAPGPTVAVLGLAVPVLDASGLVVAAVPAWTNWHRSRVRAA